MKGNRLSLILSTTVASVLLSGCGAGSDPIGCGAHCPPPHESTWTWVGGLKLPDQAGVYGTQGVASPSNMPGSRQFGVSWRDSNGNFWLFGGNGFDSTGAQQDLNDLWKFDGTNWTWVNGSDLANQPAVYGTKGVASPSNVPGARSYSVSWIDKSNNLWLFGGDGGLNDLWKFDGANWSWVGGSNLSYEAGVYGTKGTASPVNAPGGRSASVSWIDGSGDLWLFGGIGSDSFGVQGELNDLWKFDGSNWTWVGGSNAIQQAGVYGTKGTPSSFNAPGARELAVSWIDKSGNFWLFGGWGFDSTGTHNILNDLWKFDGSNWTWISGSDIRSQTGTYGTQGTASPSNVPGARQNTIGWTDSSGNLWLFGGSGRDSAGTVGPLNDLWKFDGTNWTWMSGSQNGNGIGSYGTLGVASASNLPSSRVGAVSWIDASGNLWLFGGLGQDPAGTNSLGNLNDLWRFTP